MRDIPQNPESQKRLPVQSSFRTRAENEALALASKPTASLHTNPQNTSRPTSYNARQIGWELERTAMGDGYYGNALRVAKDFALLTAEDRGVLDRYATGSNSGTDHVKLQDIARRIYFSEVRTPGQNMAAHLRAQKDAQTTDNKTITVTELRHLWLSQAEWSAWDFYCAAAALLGGQQTAEAPNEDMVAQRLEETESSLAFYRKRCTALQAVQSRMRDPERTMVCDILANGALLLDGAGSMAAERYAMPEQDASAQPAIHLERPAKAYFVAPEGVSVEAFNLGAKGSPASDEERALFEAWMLGHCWACAPWSGTEYTDQTTRVLWAAWRDRGALAKIMEDKRTQAQN